MEEVYDNVDKGALWKKVSKNSGKTYYSGYINIDGIETQISAFVPLSASDKAPALNLVVNKPVKLVDENSKFDTIKEEEFDAWDSTPQAKNNKEQLPF